MGPILVPFVFLLLTAAGDSCPQGGDEAVFPAVAGWRIAAPPGDSVYRPDNLWNIIDGAADLFLSYRFMELRIMEYSDSAGTDVRVELYRHDTRTNAFGMYSQERNPASHFLEIGTQGYVEDRVLNFLCGVYYVKLSSHREGKRGTDAMLLIGRRLAEHLRQEPGWPAALGLLPAGQRLPNTESFVAESFLGYSIFHSAFTARYESGCTLFVMNFESASLARSVAAAYMKAVGLSQEIPEGEITDVSDPHNGSIAMLLKGRILAGAFGPGGQAPAHRYLKLLDTRLPAPE